MHNEINLEGVTSVNWKIESRTKLCEGIYQRASWSGDNGKKAVMLEFLSGAVYPEHKHEMSSEQIYVISGIFCDGRDDYPEGSFIHYPIGSSHIPQSKEGCIVLVTNLDEIPIAVS